MDNFSPEQEAELITKFGVLEQMISDLFDVNLEEFTIIPTPRLEELKYEEKRWLCVMHSTCGWFDMLDYSNPKFALLNFQQLIRTVVVHSTYCPGAPPVVREENSDGD